MSLKSSLSLTIAAIIAASNLSLAFIPAASISAAESLIAFPGAEGGGMYAKGARAGENLEVYHVTSLNDSGEGSFREAVSTGNRIIVFDVAGNIMLESELEIKASNLTILGQTAPGEGICIGGQSVRFKGADEIILRYLRFRMGDNAATEEDALGIRGGKSIIIDHCSISWSVDECLSCYENMNTTVQNCIISESLTKSIHGKGSHGYGGIWGGINASFHHNLISTHDSRNPRIGTSHTVHSYNSTPDTDSLVDIRNNIFYNWQKNSSYGGENGIRVNLVNNYYKPTGGSTAHFYELYGGTNSLSTTLHLSGNVMEGQEGLSRDNWAGVSSGETVNWTRCENISDGITVDGVLKANDEFIYDYPVNTSSAEDAYTYVLENAGASIYRDSIDQRVIDNVINGTYPTGSNGSQRLIDSQTDVGGWVALYGAKPTDSDNDGISDEWEITGGTDPSSDDSTLIAANGYTNIENYANYLAEQTYEGYGVNSSLLKAEIDAAKALDPTEYSYEDRERLAAAIASAETVYNLSAPTRQQLDSEYESLAAVVNSLEKNLSSLMTDTIEKAKAIDTSGYTNESIAALLSAVEKAEQDIAAANEAEYRQDVDDIEGAIAALAPSDKVKLKKVVDFLRAADISHLKYEDRVKINNALDDAETACGYTDLTEKQIQNKISEVYSLVCKGSYERINKGVPIETKDFEDGVIGEAPDYSFKDSVTGKEIVQGYGSNGSKLLKFTYSGNVEGLYGKTYIGNLEHFMVSCDIQARYSGSDGIKLGTSDSEYSFINSYFVYCGNTVLDEDYTDFIQNYINGMVKMSVEVDVPNSKVTYYVNNIPLGSEEYIGFQPITYLNYGYRFTKGTHYFDNLELVDLNNDSYYVTGDSDNNNILTANDAAMLLSRVLSADELTDLELLLGSGALRYLDMDCSGSLTSNDSAMILAKVLDVSFITPADKLNPAPTTVSATESTTETTTVTVESTETTTSSVINYKNADGNYKFDTATGTIKGFSTDNYELELVIPSEINGTAVSEIGYGAFKEIYRLKSVTIPSSVKAIGNYAFSNCSNMETLVIEDGLETAGQECFANCGALKSVRLPSTLKTIPSKMFVYSVWLEELEIPNGIETISENAFYNCNYIEKLTIPASVTALEGNIGAKNAVIYCCAGSAAETYAVENGRSYVIIE